jgi:hypothetical protein
MVMKAAGFVDAEVTNRVDTFAGAAVEKRATRFGTFERAYKS